MDDDSAPYQLEAAIDAHIANCITPERVSQRAALFKDTFAYVGAVGQGGEGTVVKVLQKTTGKLFAVKRVEQKTDPQSGRPVAHQEVRILALLNLVGDGPGKNTIVGVPADFWFPCHPSGQQSLVMEYAPLGSLQDFINNRTLVAYYHKERYTRVLHEGFYRHIYAQLLAGLAFLHYGYGTDTYDPVKRLPKGRRPVLHRDIKPQNILVLPAPDGVHQELVIVKLADFGGALHVGTHDPTDLYCFTPGYIAPEYYKEGLSRHEANILSDVFALGATMHWAIFGRHPWVTNNGHMLFRRKHARDICHQGGTHFTAEFDASINDALAPARLRRVSVQILECLERNHEEHIRTFLAWYEEVGVPRLESERAQQAARDAASRAHARQRSRERREERLREEASLIPQRALQLTGGYILRQAAQHPLRFRCHNPLCRFQDQPNAHYHVRCADPACPDATVGLHHHSPARQLTDQVEAHYQQVLREELRRRADEQEAAQLQQQENEGEHDPVPQQRVARRAGVRLAAAPAQTEADQVAQGRARWDLFVQTARTEAEADDVEGEDSLMDVA